MSDIFVSYASEDRPRVKVLSQALEAQGWSVWWDRSIPFGQRFHQVIEQELAVARSVMVIWTEHSVGSDWVRAEAGEGMNRGVLVPVTFDDVRPPLVFRQIQTADLAAWEGDLESPVFRKLMADLESLLGAPPDPTVEPLPREEEPGGAGEPAEVPPERPARRGWTAPAWPWLLAGVLGIALLALVLGLWLIPGEPEVVERVPDDVARAKGDLSDKEDEAGSASPTDSEEVVQPPTGPAPWIADFVAQPEEVRAGEEAKLRWRAVNAEDVVIDGLGTFPVSGETSVHPRATTTYRMTARSADGRTAIDSEVVIVEEGTASPGVSGPVVMREGQSVDLDSVKMTGVLRSLDDLQLTEGDNDRVTITRLNGALFEVVEHGRECSELEPAELSRRVFPLGKLRPNLYLCVRTDAGRPSVCQVSEVDTRSRVATLEMRCTTR